MWEQRLYFFIFFCVSFASVSSSPEASIHTEVKAVVDEIDSQMQRHFTPAQKARFKSGPLTGRGHLSSEQLAHGGDSLPSSAAGTNAAAEAAGASMRFKSANRFRGATVLKKVPRRL